jgi:hypothetical protein
MVTVVLEEPAAFILREQVKVLVAYFFRMLVATYKATQNM